MLTGIFTVLFANAQDNSPVTATKIIKDYPLQVTWHRTTVLVFPAPIQDADRGDSYILAEQAAGVENVLKVKAGERGFEPSNLHVITKDGKVYAFNVTYADDPQHYTIDVAGKYPHAPVTFDGISLNSRQLELASATIMGIPPFIKKVGKSKHGMELSLDGIFVKEDVLFFRYTLKNSTKIGYDSMVPRFYIKDKKRAKRTAVQQTSVEPVYINNYGKPEDESGQSIIVAFPKFTIAESKYFISEIMEQGGDRNLETKIDQKKLLKAKSLR